MKELLLKRKGKFILYVIACFYPVVTAMLQNLAFALLIGSIQVGKMDYFYKVFALSVVFAFVGSLLYIASRLMRIGYMRDTILDVRILAFEKILKHSYTSFSKKSKDIYISNLVNDINTFENHFFHKLLNVIYNCGAYFTSLVVLAFLDFRFALGIFIVSVIMFLVIKTFENKTVKLQQDISNENEKFTLDTSNTLNGLEILKLNNVEDKFLYKSLKAIDKVERKKLQYTVFTEGQRSITKLLANFIFVGMIIYLLNQVITGSSFTKITLMLQLGNWCLLPICEVFPMLNELKASIKIYAKITKQENEVIHTIKYDNIFNFNSNIEVNSLCFNYAGKNILKDVSLQIEKGKKYLLKGASGSGKSTLIKLLSKVYDNYDGTIKLDGIDYKDIDETSFNKHISFIYQDVFLFEDTIKNNITLFKEFHENEIADIVEKSGLKDFMSTKPLGLDEILLENGKNLSGGERQRISIARALVKNSDILFVDEGTSGLDEELGRAIESTILSLNNTVIAISHRYYEGITEKYDFILEIVDGRINKYSSQEYFGGVA